MDDKFDANDDKLPKYGKEYSDSGLWDKVKNVAKVAGKDVIYNVLLLFYAMKSDKVSLKERTMIIGALGYFILPADIIPDILTAVGYTDDIALIFAVLKLLACVDDDIKKQANAKLRDWFE